MIDTLLDSIKADRRMSLNHWRYRLLHWCFSVTATRPEDSHLHRALYTHYCPLFHLTNLIAIFSPVILVLKTIIGGIELLIAIFKPVLAAIAATAAGFKASRKKEPTEQTEVQLASSEIGLIGRILKDNQQFGPSHFEIFWGSFSDKFPHLTQELVETEFLRVTTYLAAARERAEAWRKRQRAWIVIWVGFSRAVIKCILTAFYIALFVGVAIVTTMFGGGIVVWCVEAAKDLWHFFTGFSLFGVAEMMLKTILGGVALWFLCVLTWEHNRKLRSLTSTAFNKILPPLELAYDVVHAAFAWVVSVVRGVKEFVGMFYEENCPPIHLVRDGDEQLEDCGEAR